MKLLTAIGICIIIIESIILFFDIAVYHYIKGLKDDWTY